MPRPKLVHNRILAIDPGSREMGYAVLYDRELVLGGVKDMRAFRPLDVLLHKTREHVRDIVRRYEIETVVIEQTFFTNNKNTLGLIAQGEDIKLLARRLGLRFAAYSPRTARKRVLGAGGASKLQVAEVVCGLYPELRMHATNDRKWKDKWWCNLYDAICVGLAFVYEEEGKRQTRRTGA